MTTSGQSTLALFAALLGLAFIPGASAAEKAAAPAKALVISDTATAQLTIAGINKKERRITLRDKNGIESDMIAGDEVRNFDQIKKGDIVDIEYRQAAASRLEKADKANAAVDAQTMERASAGDKPGMVTTNTQSIVATVLEINKKERLLTVQGPRGGIVTVKVPADVPAFDSLKKGDKISALYSEALAVSVRPAAKK